MPQYVLAMIIFGSIGLFAREIELPSTLLALSRGVLGAGFLVIAGLAAGMRPDLKAIRANGPQLLLTGGAIGLNWILLFEAFRNTSIAAATVLYYLAPVLAMAFSTLLLGERLTRLKLLCTAAALAGLVLVALPDMTGSGRQNGGYGTLCAVGAAVCYAAVILSNRLIGRREPIPAGDSAALQLLAASLVLTPYALASTTAGDFLSFAASPLQVVLLLVLGLVHTGLAYRLYFSGLRVLDAARIAVFAYLDPAVAILLSLVVLGESLSRTAVAGTVLILGAAVVLEFRGRRTGT